MPDRLVEQDAAPARSEHNGLRTGGSGDGPEGGDRLARGLAADLGGREILVEAEVDPAPAAVEASAPLTAFAERDAADAQAAQVLPVFGEVTQGVGDEDLARLIRIAGRHLPDAAVVRPSGGVGLAHQLDLARDLDGRQRLMDLVVRGQRRARERHRARIAVAFGDQRGRLRRAQERRFVQIVRVGVAHLGAPDGAHAHSRDGADLRAADLALVERDGGGGGALDVHLGEFGAAGHGRRKQLLEKKKRQDGRPGGHGLPDGSRHGKEVTRAGREGKRNGARLDEPASPESPPRPCGSSSAFRCRTRRARPPLPPCRP